MIVSFDALARFDRGTALKPAIRMYIRWCGQASRRVGDGVPQTVGWWQVLELQQVAAAAWPLVKDALDTGELAAGSADSTKMYRLIKPVLRQSVARSLCLPSGMPGAPSNRGS
jgi:hypothetical protein